MLTGSALLFIKFLRWNPGLLHIISTNILLCETVLIYLALRLAHVAAIHAGIFQTLKCALPVHLQALSKEPPSICPLPAPGQLPFPQQIRRHTGPPILASGLCHHSLCEGRAFVRGGRLSVSEIIHLVHCAPSFLSASLILSMTLNLFYFSI